MRVCQVLASSGFGGLEKHTIELAKMLKIKGIDVTVIASPEYENSFKNVNFIPLNLNKSRKNINILFKLYKILKKEKFDIIHTQANKATSMITTLKPFLNINIISTLHNYKKDLKAFKKSDYVITVSNKIGENLKRDNITTVYNGIDFKIDKFSKKELFSKYNVPENKFVLCSVARFTKVKRFDILLKSIKNLDVYLILVGDGEEMSSLKKLAKKLSIENKITFAGSLENSEAKKLVSSSNLFVMTSDKEGFPYTFIETMFCKTPFISTPVSDVKEFISDKYIIPFDNVEETTNKISFIKENYNEVEKDFNSIFEFSNKKLTLENMTNETINLYKKIGN